MTRINRRDFAKASTLGLGFVSSRSATIGAGPAVIEPFDYDGVRLNPSRLLTQYEGAREFYLGLSDANILHGFRKEAGLSAPGKPLRGLVSRHFGNDFRPVAERHVAHVSRYGRHCDAGQGSVFVG